MANNTDYGFFLHTTYLFNEIGDEYNPELLRNLYRNNNNLALAINAKDVGIYPLTEFVNGQTYFPDPSLSSTTAQVPEYRQVFRKVINFGALPNAGTKSTAHGIAPTATFSFTRIYGTATNPSGFSSLPLPYASATAANNIELNVDGTNVNVTTGIDRTAYTTTYIVLEYIKQ